MRVKRVKNDDEGIYHLISRIVDRDFKLTDPEKDIFVTMMRKAESFSGVNILTFAVMSNHFHILVRIPGKSERTVSDEEVLDRYRALYGKKSADIKEQLWKEWKTSGEDGKKALEKDRSALLRRMYDISEFMKLIKQRYSISYNIRHNREGTLWSDRFKSILVEKGSEAMYTIASYIDLNAVRAGIVANPKDYKWCGYAEACSGVFEALDGISRIVSPDKGQVVKVLPEGQVLKNDDAGVGERILVKYRQLLGTEGQALEKRQGYTKEEIKAIFEEKKMIPRAIMLRTRIRHFEFGGVIGSEKFVSDIIASSKNKFGLDDKPVQVLKSGGLQHLWVGREYRHCELMDEVMESCAS